MRIIGRAEVERLLDFPSCIAALEDVFLRRARGEPTPSGVLGVHVPDGGFHVKAAAAFLDDRQYFAAKVNANFPGNPARHGLPTIQGMLGLFDAGRGVPLALMDSMSVTTIRTAAATAVAAKQLALPGSDSLAIIGCGVQAVAHVTAIRAVRPVTSVAAFDTNAGSLERFVRALARPGDLAVRAATSVEDATRDAHIVVTCTPSTVPFLGTPHVRPGAFIAAVGADNEHKSEIEPGFMGAAAVVVDDFEQCAAIGDLHHAIAAGTMRRDAVRASLADVVADPHRGRWNDAEVVIFDSTGVAIEDVAAAVVVLRRAEATGAGIVIALEQAR